MAVDKTAGITVNFCSLVGFGKWLKNNGFFDPEWAGLEHAFLFIDGKLIGRVESQLQKAISINGLEAAPRQTDRDLGYYSLRF